MKRIWTVLVRVFIGAFLMAGQVPAAIHRVDIALGSDIASCGSEVAPCRSIQQAVNLAASGDTVLVAAGVYFYQSVLDPCDAEESGVVCVAAKELTLLGGFDGLDWQLPDPALRLSIIDGGGSQRGIRVIKGSLQGPPTSLRMEGFTVRNGFVLETGGADAFGGGLKATLADVELRDMIFEDNTVIGGAAGSGVGGRAAGAGAYISSAVDFRRVVVLERLDFRRNRATGGTGPLSGGVGLGGGLLVDQADITGFELDFQDNEARGGSSSGSGNPGGLNADGLGGGAAFLNDTDTLLQQVIASGNLAVGGDAGIDDGDQAGNGFGGAIYVENGDLEVIDADLQSNEALGGGSFHGGIANGGAVMGYRATVRLERVVMVENRVTGGDTKGSCTSPDAKCGGGAGGSAVRFTRVDLGSGVRGDLIDCVVADNVATRGSGAGQGGGGAVFYEGAEGSIVHTSLARNSFGSDGLQGQAITVATRLGTNPSEVEVSYSIIADHTSLDAMPAVHVLNLSTVTFDTGIFAGNEKDTNADFPSSQVGTYIGLGTMLLESDAGFLSPGPPGFDYHLAANSPAVDRAAGSSQPTDLDRGARDVTPDIGADEIGSAAYRLLVSKRGLGTGTITTLPPGISCGADCSEIFADGTGVTLQFVADTGSILQGWGGDADCADGSLSMVADRSCEAIVVEESGATIVVRKETSPAGVPDAFDFTGDVTGSISDGQELIRTALPPGTYSVTEIASAAFPLTKIECDDADSVGNVGTRTATLQLQLGERVTCVFTNTTRTCPIIPDLVLEGEVVTGIVVEEACNSVTGRDYQVETSGEVTFRAGLEILLEDGFVVESGGSFAAVIEIP